MLLDFCVIKVQLIHDLIETVDPEIEGPVITDEVETLTLYNTQLDMELKISDSAEIEGNKFTLSIWNLPKDTKMTDGDYVIMEYYWQANPAKSSGPKVGVVTSVKKDVDGLDVKYVLTGTIVEHFLFNHKKVEAPGIIYNIEDYLTTLQLFGYTDLVSQIESITKDTILNTPIYTLDKTLLDITNEIIDILSAQFTLSIKVRLDYKTTVVIYNPDADIEPSLTDLFVLNDDDVFVIKTSLDKIQGEAFYMYVEIFGIPTLVRTGLLKYKDEVYQIDEISHMITISNGYNMNIYAHTNISEIVVEEE